MFPQLCYFIVIVRQLVSGRYVYSQVRTAAMILKYIGLDQTSEVIFTSLAAFDNT